MKLFGTFNHKIKQLLGTANPQKSVSNEDDWLVEKFQSEAKNGNADAQNNLGMLYANGLNVKKNVNEALFWFRRSADQGNAAGLCNLGLMYLQGYGVEKDSEEAAKFIRAAAEKGVAIAQFTMGEMYCDGNGVPHDYSKAKKWFKSAALQGNKHAINALKNLDHEFAAKLFRKSQN